MVQENDVSARAKSPSFSDESIKKVVFFNKQ